MSNASFVSTEMMLPFILLMWCITSIDLWMLHHPCIPGIITVYDSSNILLSSVCYSFVEDFYIYVHQRYWPVIFFSCMSLSDFGIKIMPASQNEFESVPSSSIFWKSSRRAGIRSSLNVW